MMEGKQVTITEEKSTEFDALKHLLQAKYHAKKAEELFEDGSRGENVANNVRRWAEKSNSVATTYLEEKSEENKGDD